ncbi:MAG: RluA family pseudouridine synthase [Robiginitalea sp.]|jgi:23S rRNA pseudouridine1911/1915/1917 synthase
MSPELEGQDQPEEDELFEHHCFTAADGQEPLRIDKFLMNLIRNATRNKIQKAAKDGNIRVNDNVVKQNYRVKPGDTVRVLFEHPPYEYQILPEDIPLSVVYEDDTLLVVDKPAGIVVHPGHGNYSGTLLNALANHLGDMPMNSDNRPGLVHRIDKDTSGLLVIAKTEMAMTHLARQFFDKTTEREYLALVWGNVEADSGTIEGAIGRNPKNRLQMQVFPEGDYGKPAVTHYEVLERFRYVTLVSCRLETGRTHQIRVHLKYLGHPLFNDARYGGDRILKGTTFSKYRQFVENAFKLLPRQALHARTLGFIHPVSGEHLFFQAEVPEDMASCIEKWRQYTRHQRGS